MTTDIPLTRTQVDILTLAFKRSTYTAFRDDTVTICDGLVESGHLSTGQDFQYSITRKGAEAIGQQVATPSVLTETTVSAVSFVSLLPPVPDDALTVIVLTDDLLTAYRDAERLKMRSRVLYAAALEKVVRLLGEAIERV